MKIKFRKIEMSQSLALCPANFPPRHAYEAIVDGHAIGHVRGDGQSWVGIRLDGTRLGGLVCPTRQSAAEELCGMKP